MDELLRSEPKIGEKKFNLTQSVQPKIGVNGDDDPSLSPEEDYNTRHIKPKKNPITKRHLIPLEEEKVSHVQQQNFEEETVFANKKNKKNKKFHSTIQEEEDEDQNTAYFDSKPDIQRNNPPEEIKINQANSNKNKVILQVLSNKTDKTERHIFYKDFKIGLSSANDLVLAPNKKLGIHNDISSVHCKVKLNAENSFQLEDYDSGSGTFFQLIPKQKYNLQEGETYSMGLSLLTIFAITEKSLEISIINNGNEKIVNYEKKKIKIGSDKENDLVLKDKLVSKSHCIIKEKQNGGFVLRDLESTNGFYFVC